MRKLKVSSIVLDFDLYPRNNIDAHNVRCIVDALAAGAEVPPIVIDKKTKRVVDGFHRVKAFRQHYGEDATIEAIEKSYRDDAELFLDAVRYNGAHGARLDPCDRTRCVHISERLGLSVEQVAGVLHMPVDKLAKLRVNRTAQSGKLHVPLKRTIQHKAGQKLTKKQVEANEHLSGMNQVFYANQLIWLIESDLLDTTDDNLMERLGVLQQLLDGVVAQVV